ncbi:hypothetical protein N9140_00425 [bacterium]|nr:hypothetical protein [bacterium]
MPTQEKRPPNQSSTSQRETMTKSLLGQSSSSHNDVISTKPLLAYSSQNLASRGCEKCLDTLKIEPTNAANVHHPPTTKIHPPHQPQIIKMAIPSKPLDYVR